jgi:RND family efflux transporter, MFP subunit
MRAFFKKYRWLVLITVVTLSYFSFQYWQGASLQGYVVADSPLVQRVVAAGRGTNEARVQISAEATGLVIKRLVSEGEHVDKGQVLFELRADEILAQLSSAQAELSNLNEVQRPQAQADVLLARIKLEQATRERKRRETLLAAELLNIEAVEQARNQEEFAATELKNAELALSAVQPQGAEARKLKAQVVALQAQLAKATVKSPADGQVLTRHFEEGDVVQPNDILMTMALDGAIEVRAPMDERNLPQLALGQSAQIIADAYPTQPFPASVSYLAPAVDPQRGTIEVRLLLDEPPEFLRQDMTVSVTVESARKANAIVVPNEALFAIEGDRARVWRVISGKTQAQDVVLGLRGLTQSEIVTGLHVNDRVLTEFDRTMVSDRRVRLVLSQSISKP